MSRKIEFRSQPLREGVANRRIWPPNWRLTSDRFDFGSLTNNFDAKNGLKLSVWDFSWNLEDKILTFLEFSLPLPLRKMITLQTQWESLFPPSPKNGAFGTWASFTRNLKRPKFKFSIWNLEDKILTLLRGALLLHFEKRSDCRLD